MISAIVAVDENYGIGYKGNLLCRIRSDLDRFRRLTTGNIVVMGRKTWDSLPTKPLPNRTNIVITNNVDEFELKNGVIFTTLDLLKETICEIGEIYDVFVIGGSQIYKELLPYCKILHLTKIHKSFEEIDAYFPKIEEDENWKAEIIGDIFSTDNGTEYQFCVYENLLMKQGET